MQSMEQVASREIEDTKSLRLYICSLIRSTLISHHSLVPTVQVYYTFIKQNSLIYICVSLIRYQSTSSAQ